MARNGVEIQQLEGTPSSEESPSDLFGGPGRCKSSSHDHHSLPVNIAKSGGQEPSSGGVEGGSRVTRDGKTKFHREVDAAQLIQKLEDKLGKKDKEIRQLMDTMAFQTMTINKHEKLEKELEEVKKKNEELKRTNVDLELQNRQIRSELEHFHWSRDGGQPSLTREQLMGGTGAQGDAVWPLAALSDQGSVVTVPEDSIDSFDLIPEVGDKIDTTKDKAFNEKGKQQLEDEPMNLETSDETESKQKGQLTTALLQEQVKEHHEAYRKERNDRVMLNEKYRALKRDVRVVTSERKLALQRAEEAEAEAEKAKEEVSKLREIIEQMRTARGSSTSAPSLPSAVPSPRRWTDPDPPRDPLTCVWPRNNYKLIMPPHYLRSQRSRSSRSDTSSPVNFEFTSQGEQNPPVVSRRPLQWDTGEKKESKEWDLDELGMKRDRSASVTGSPDFDEIYDIKKTMKKLDDADRWPCQACKYRNRARRSTCDYCGTVDAVQRQRHNKFT